MPVTKTIHVPHLGGIDAGYQMPYPYNPSKPTVVLVNSFMTSAELFQSQFSDNRLTDAANLIAIELLGHGQTRTKSENFTYWDTAIMNLQVLDALGIEKAYVLGTSQGGWVTVRMALLAPEKIAGIMPLGTSMDYESERSRALGCWDGAAAASGSIKAWTTTQPTSSFEPGDDFADFLITSGFGKDCDQSVREHWRREVRDKYKGDDGRKRARMAAINLKGRDGLHDRLFDIRCPVLWLHGTADVVYSVANAEEEIKLFTSSPDARLVTISGGHHYLSHTHPEEVNRYLIQFVSEAQSPKRDGKL